MPPPQSLAVIGSRWTLQILVLLLDGPMRFTDLRRGLPDISAKLLTVRLRELENAGVVSRGQIAASAAVCAYSLSSRVESLRSALELLARWQGPAGPE